MEEVLRLLLPVPILIISFLIIDGAFSVLIWLADQITSAIDDS
jgi:hypothetical protein